MIHDQLKHLVITDFIPQNEFPTKTNSSLGVEGFFDCSNFANVIHTDFDDFKAQFVFLAFA